METYLSMRSFSTRLRKCGDIDPQGIVCPTGVSRELTEKFLRVLRAESMAEISDIPDMEIAQMINDGAALCSIIDSDNLLSAGKHFIERLSGTKSVMMRKRVL